MTEVTQVFMLEQFRKIRADMTELRELSRDIVLRLGAIEGHLSGFQMSELRQNVELDRIRSPLERIERRLELADE